MKKLIATILMLALALSCSMLIACDSNSDEHKHTFATKWTSDETHHWHASTCGHKDQIRQKAAHSYDEDDNCTVCGLFNPNHEHEFSSQWNSDETYHWKTATCIHTDEIGRKAEHTWDNGVITTPATCTEEGVKTFTCTECDKTRIEIADALGHDEVLHEAQAATCTEIGWETYVTCSRCDYTTYEEITALGHTYADNWSSNSTHHWHEATCEHTDEVSGRAEHNYDDDNICTICGYLLSYTRVNASDTPTANGEYILFGSYPQSKVTDSGLTMTLTSLAGTLPTSSNSYDWTSYGYYVSGSVSNYMWYQDMTYNEEQYRAVYFTSYRPYRTTYSSSTGYTYQDDNGYVTSTVYVFKYEPIKWRILIEESGKAFLLCEMIIDSREHYISSNGSARTIDGQTVYENNYKYSTIRAWLNDTFYNTAFNSLQQQIIEVTEVDNSVSSTMYSSNSYACENTQDKIFLPSAQEITTSEYGFATSTSTDDTARRKKTTAYAQCQGAYTSTSSSYLGNGVWWLRSPRSYYRGDARYVRGGGYVLDYDLVFSTNYGVCPALWITL